MATPKDIVCKQHGPAPVALACRHIAGGVACGFHIAPGNPEPPEAWCDRCDEALATAGEWTIELTKQAEMTVVCTYCYDLAAQRNQNLPKLTRGERVALSGEEYRALCAHAVARIAEQQETAREKWYFDAYARWDFDEEARTLAFIDTMRPTLVTDVRIVGAYSTRTGAFRWGWGSYPTGSLLIEGVATLKMFGEVRGLGPLTTSEWRCRPQDCWELTAVAGYLLGCDGVYRADFDDKLWFMLLSGWRHARRGATEPGNDFGLDA